MSAVDEALTTLDAGLPTAAFDRPVVTPAERAPAVVTAFGPA